MRHHPHLRSGRTTPEPGGRDREAVAGCRCDGPAAGTRPWYRSAGGYQPVQAEGRKLYELICGAVQDYLLASVRDAPALMLVEDMHWFDEDTVEAVRRLLDTDLGGHVMIVMTEPRPCSAARGVASPRFSSSDHSASDETDRLITALHPDATRPRSARCSAAATACRSTSKKWSPSSRTGRRTPRPWSACPTRSTRRCSHGCGPARIPCGWSKPRPSSAAASNGVSCPRPSTCPRHELDAGAGRTGRRPGPRAGRKGHLAFPSRVAS